MFKNTISILTGVLVLTGVSLSSVVSHAAVVDGISLPSPQGIDGNDYENPVPHRSLTTSLGSLPSSITNASIGLFSNNTFRVVHDSDYTFTLQYGNTITNATASNQIAFIDLSPDGILWATNSPLTKAFTPASNTVGTLQFTISATNFGANMLARFRGVTNAGVAGNGPITPTKLIVTSWRVRQIRQN